MVIARGVFNHEKVSSCKKFNYAGIMFDDVFYLFCPCIYCTSKKRVVDNVFMYPTDPYSYPTCTGWVPCKKIFTSSKKASKTYVRETAWKVIDTTYLYKAATSRGKVFYTKYKMKQLYRCRMHYKKDQRNTRKMKWIRLQYRIWEQQKRNRKNLTKNGN